MNHRAIFAGKIALSVLFAFEGFMVAQPAQAAGLTPVQISSVLTLLASFNVDQTTLANVWGSLVGSAGKGSVSFIAGADAGSARIPAGTQVPFTTFMLANNTGSPVSVAGVTVTRVGSGSDSGLSSVELTDGAGTVLDAPQKLDANHQATIGGAFTLAPGEVKMLTVAATIAAKNKAKNNQKIGFDIVAINAAAALNGSLPIKGPEHKVDTGLAPGSAPQY